MNAIWHFPIMILFSFIIFLVVIRIVIGKNDYKEKQKLIIYLAIVVVVVGMLFGKYGANWGLKWWIYYPVPLLMNVILPPVLLKMNIKRTIIYLVLSLISAPFIHIFFSMVLGWNEYMPFWKL